MGFGGFHLDHVQKMNTAGAPCQRSSIMRGPVPWSEGSQKEMAHKLIICGHKNLGQV